jgi:DNA gyrase inhibitor GyrI
MSAADTFHLKDTPEETMLPAMHFVYVQHIGPLSETATKAWVSLYTHLAEIKAVATVVKLLSMFQVEPEPLYRAGVSVTEKPASLPEGFVYEYCEAGKYNKFEVTGSYRHMSAARDRVTEIVKDSKMPVRPDGYYVQYYANDPETTPENELRTDILVPLQ